MPRTLVARVLSQQARNSSFPAPPIQTTPPADREAGLAAEHPLHRPPILMDRWKDSMRAWTDGRTLLSHRSDHQHVDELLIDPALKGANLSPGHIPLSAVATAQELAGEST